jgi:hypothetical protein
MVRRVLTGNSAESHSQNRKSSLLNGVRDDTSEDEDEAGLLGVPEHRSRDWWAFHLCRITAARMQRWKRSVFRQILGGMFLTVFVWIHSTTSLHRQT